MLIFSGLGEIFVSIEKQLIHPEFLTQTFQIILVFISLKSSTDPGDHYQVTAWVSWHFPTPTWTIRRIVPCDNFTDEGLLRTWGMYLTTARPFSLLKLHSKMNCSVQTEKRGLKLSQNAQTSKIDNFLISQRFRTQYVKKMYHSMEFVACYSWLAPCVAGEWRRAGTWELRHPGVDPVARQLQGAQRQDHLQRHHQPPRSSAMPLLRSFEQGNKRTRGGSIFCECRS